MKKSRWISLLILLVLIGVYFIARHGQPREKDVRFFKADSTLVTKVILSSVEDTIIVVKQGKTWKLTFPLAWEVNEQQLSTFFKMVLPITTSATPMSEDPNLQSMYKVDAKSAVQVKTYGKGGKLLDHVYIGNGANTTFDYGRREGEKAIYQFSDNITNLVSPDIFQWRSPKIINLKANQIDHIDVTYGKGAYTLSWSGDSLRYTDRKESFIIPPYNRAQYKVINALENMMTWQFIDTNTQQYDRDFEHPTCSVNIYLKDKTVRTLSFISRTITAQSATDQMGENLQILMRVDNKPAPLYQMSADFLNRFTRAAAHFKAEYE